MPRKRSLTSTVAGGDLRASLEAIRDHVAAELEGGAVCKNCGGSLSSPTAQLAKQLADVLERLDALPGEEVSTVDDLARRRADRLPNAGAQAGSPVQRDGG